MRPVARLRRAIVFARSSVIPGGAASAFARGFNALWLANPESMTSGLPAFSGFRVRAFRRAPE